MQRTGQCGASALGGIVTSRVEQVAWKQGQKSVLGGGGTGRGSRQRRNGSSVSGTVKNLFNSITCFSSLKGSFPEPILRANC